MMEKKKPVALIILIIVIAGMIIGIAIKVAIVIIWSNSSDNPYRIVDKVIDYCIKSNTFSFSDVTNFEWDIAYVDRETYSSGEGLKKAYTIDAELTRLDSEIAYRIVFCRGGKFAKELVLSLDRINVYDVSEVKPHDLFSVQWKPYSDRNVLELRSMGLVSEDHAVISPSKEYTLKMDVTKEEGVRGFHNLVCSIDNKEVFRSKEFFRFRDANFVLWGDNDTFWVYSGDVGTFYWVKTGDSWEKKSYSENRDSVKVPDTLKQLRPSSFT